MAKEYTVYQVRIDGIIRYIGRTNNLHRRELEHNAGLRNNKEKELYNKMRDLGLTKIELEVVKIFKTKIESKRYEMFLILEDYFKDKELYQKIPNISDR